MRGLSFFVLLAAASLEAAVSGDAQICAQAGPSEIVIIADKENDPGIIASDLIAQAEHDVSAQSILITDDASLADTVLNSVDDQISSLSRKDIASKSWNNNGAIIIVSGIEKSIELANKLAPEHLELAVKDANNYIKEVKNAVSYTHLTLPTILLV